MANTQVNFITIQSTSFIINVLCIKTIDCFKIINKVLIINILKLYTNYYIIPFRLSQALKNCSLSLMVEHYSSKMLILVRFQKGINVLSISLKSRMTLSLLDIRKSIAFGLGCLL